MALSNLGPGPGPKVRQRSCVYPAATSVIAHSLLCQIRGDATSEGQLSSDPSVATEDTRDPHLKVPSPVGSPRSALDSTVFRFKNKFIFLKILLKIIFFQTRF